MNKLTLFFALFSIFLSIVGFTVVIHESKATIHYGFVNTEKLLNSFTESRIAVESIQQEESKWSKKRSVLEDSLKAFEKRLEVVYDTISLEKKRALKKEHSQRIEELDRFGLAQETAISNMQTEKLAAIYEKINAAISEYAQTRNLDVIFASSHGSIVYGEGTAADLTQDFLQFLNARYE